MNYQNGKIYKLVNDINDMIYIGSTTQLLYRRLANHKDSSKTRTSKIYTAMKEIGVAHFKIVLLEACACNSKAELEAREFEVTNAHDKAKLYNSMFDKHHGEEAKKAMTKYRTGRALKRGCISHFCNTKRTQFGYSFQWKSADGSQNNKRYAYGMKRTPQEAYMLCVAMRDEIYPLTNEDYLDELPFRE